jgi:hypothetical protein
MPTAIAATAAYRNKVATAAATGAALPKAAWLAFGSGDAPYSPDVDTALQAEFLRVATSNEVSGPSLTVRGVLSGAADGTLMGRRVVAPKELEPETEIEFEIVFEY